MTSPLHPSAAAAAPGPVSASTLAVRRWQAPPEWLAPAERTRAAAIRGLSQRDAWLTARWAAKRLVAARLPGWDATPDLRRLAAIEIRSRNAAGRGVRPRVLVAGREAAIGVSIAHADERVIVAAGPATAPLGVDLTPIAAFARPASRWWLTAGERLDAAQLDAAAGAAQAAAVWSVKEAVYKAWLAAEPFCPRAIEVRLRGGRIVGCTAGGRTVPPAAIRSWRLAGHAVCLVHARGAPGAES